LYLPFIETMRSSVFVMHAEQIIWSRFPSDHHRL
jgi:hypothetical protein